MFGGFFKGRTFLVTGAAGVKGSWLALELLEAGARVVGVDIKTPEPDSNFCAAGLRRRIDFVQGDVADLSLMHDLMKGIDGVFHLAAVSLVQEAHRDPLEAYRSNTQGCATVLEAIRRSDTVRYAVFISTDKVYKSKGGEAWVETDPLVATGPYPVSKACAEFIISDYYHQYLGARGQKVGIGRAGNVIVGGDVYSSRRTGGGGRLFVDCFEALMEGRSPVVFQPDFTRPYTYGLDIVAGYMALMSRLDQDGVDGEAFNFGPHERVGVKNADLAAKICALWNPGISWKAGPPREEPFERQSLSWDKARQRLAWRPAFTLDEALRDTYRWYKEWFDRGKKSGEGSLQAFDHDLIGEHRDAARRQGIRWALEAR